ncbi:MAG: hypothetical protein EOP84_27150 [Verrucomicrobiaceae bacterium]|nr:MAG: hypothetical protein EOP84_27150 [Verrucomicrobiaceae bacterium]
MSTSDFNPYTSPSSSVAPPSGTLAAAQPQLSFFRDGKFLVVRDGAELPLVCIRTNEPVKDGSWRKKVKITWNPTWVFFLILVNVIVLFIVALVTQKKAKITYSLSSAARGQIARKRMIGLALLLAAIGCTVIGANLADPDMLPWAIIGSIVLLLASVVIFVLSNPIKAGGYVNGWFKLKGCSPAFLDTLPNHSGLL